jgi:excisionase family DNA binding protein
VRFAQDSSGVASDGWVTLAEASRTLGVNESTLRRWADAGQVRTFRTPGGHRRFSRSDLATLTASRPAAGESRTTLGELAVSRIRRRMQRPPQQTEAWYAVLTEEERLRLRLLGRRLVALIGEYFARRARRPRLTDEARAIGQAYGYELRRNGTSLRNALAAFMFFRHALDDTARQLAIKNGLSIDETIDGLEHIANLADEVLLAIAEAYEASEPGAGKFGEHERVPAASGAGNGLLPHLR